MGICFERRADYVILIVYPHLNFNLPFSLFFASSERRKTLLELSFYLSWFKRDISKISVKLGTFPIALTIEPNLVQPSPTPSSQHTCCLLFDPHWNHIKRWRKIPWKCFYDVNRPVMPQKTLKNVTMTMMVSDGCETNCFTWGQPTNYVKMSVEIPLRQNRRSTLFVALAFDKINRFNVRISTPQLRTCLGKSRAVLKNL